MTVIMGYDIALWLAGSLFLLAVASGIVVGYVVGRYSGA